MNLHRPNGLQAILAHVCRAPVMRILLAAAYVAIAAASLAPKAYRPTSGLVPGAMEHFAAYLVLGLLGAAILRGRIAWWQLALLNAAFAAALEAGQLFAPGRVTAFADFGASALGSLVGILAVHVLWQRGRS
jgi:VanZ family protein